MMELHQSSVNSNVRWQPGLPDFVMFLAAVLLIIVSTPWGIGVGYDSTFYLSAADGVRAGQGLARMDPNGGWIPLTHFPPLYPLVVAGWGAITSVPSPVAARALSVLVFGLNVLLAAGAVRAWSGSLSAGWMAGAWFLISPIVFERHLWAMSESLYFTLMLG
ncbi:MAG: hypothetical protein WBR18_10760, partial [Anaerolineales bacterium]